MPKNICMWNHHWLVKGFFANRESRGKRTLSKANHENINASLPFPFKTYIHFSFCGDRDNRPQRKKISRSPKSCSRISPPRITSIPRREVLQNPEGIRKFSNEFIMHSFNLSFGRSQPACRKSFFSYFELIIRIIRMWEEGGRHRIFSLLMPSWLFATRYF